MSDKNDAYPWVRLQKDIVCNGRLIACCQSEDDAERIVAEHNFGATEVLYELSGHLGVHPEIAAVSPYNARDLMEMMLAAVKEDRAKLEEARDIRQRTQDMAYEEAVRAGKSEAGLKEKNQLLIDLLFLASGDVSNGYILEHINKILREAGLIASSPHAHEKERARVSANQKELDQRMSKLLREPS